MASIKVSELTEATDFNTNDYAMIVQSNQSKKITKANIFKEQKNSERYLTSEVTTNKTWINGKPIYRKVINCGSLLNNDTKIVSHGISDLEFVIKLRLMCITGTIWYEANIAGTTGIFNGGIVAIRANTTDLQIGTTFDATQHVGYAIIEYTKAS